MFTGLSDVYGMLKRLQASSIGALLSPQGSGLYRQASVECDNDMQEAGARMHF